MAKALENKFLGGAIMNDNENIKETAKDRRIVLYEDSECVLERRSSRYYLELYDKDGAFLREIVVNMKDNGKITTGVGV